MEEAWNRLITPKTFTKPNWPLVCCDKPMTIEEDTSAQCYECGKNIWPAVPCATRDQYYANGGRRRTPYHRIKYFREWMLHILGYPTYVDEDTMQKIKEELARRKADSTGLKKDLEKIKATETYQGYFLSFFFNHRRCYSRGF